MQSIALVTVTRNGYLPARQTEMNDSPPSTAPNQIITGMSLVRPLCVVALGLSGYLLWGSLSHERLFGCGVESGCGTVLGSRWSHLFGFPVSAFALLWYAALLFTTAAVGRVEQAASRRKLRFLTTAAAAGLLGAAAWFVGLQLFVLHTICPFCMAAHACGFLIGLLILFNLGRGAEGAEESVSPQGTRLRFGFGVLAGFLAAAFLAIGQVLERPKTYSVVSTAGSVARKTPRILQLYGGAFRLDLSEVPLIGSTEAPCVIVHLFDYSCAHCRAVHPKLLELCHQLSNQVAVVSLPMPLATNCNRLLKRPIPAHVNACAYAYSGLAVWRADRKKLSAFDDWMFAPSKPPLPEAVHAEAMQLVGTNQFQQVLTDPWIKAQLDLSIRLYETNYYLYRKQDLPELMIGTNLVSGEVRDVNDLFKLVSDQFSIRKAQSK